MERWRASELVALMDEKTCAMVHTAEAAAGTLEASPSKHVCVQARPPFCHSTRDRGQFLNIYP